ncbi:sensor histidine kinase [Actinoplanes sp. CA-051413]|uniref:sensor histidine kinase n=1 Tax=Actinoplanes sp. CA-051413 TaxID=3239899 RepID=UPI003D98838E
MTASRPIRLATIPVVLCVALYCVYRILEVVPWGGYDPGFDPGGQVLATGVILATGVVQLRLAFTRLSGLRAGALLGAQVLLVYGPYLVFGSLWDPSGAFVVAAVLLTFAGRYSWAVAAFAVLCDLTIRVMLDQPGIVDADGGVFYPRVAYSAIVAVANGLLLFGMSRLSQLVRDLDTTRAAGAWLEVMDERLRIARRLREVVGERLTSIIKTCRRTDAALDSDEARAVAGAAREALAQVRTVADDYRDRSLAAEVAAARTVLTAAGVEVTTGPVPEDLPGPVDALLGSILRRTVIDALRAIRPMSCRIELDGSAWLRVSCTGGEPGRPAPDGIAEEVERLGGRLQAGSGPGSTDGIDVRIPVQAHRSGGARSPRSVAAAPWLAWWIVAVLELDLFVTTLARTQASWSFLEPVSTPRLICIIALVVPLSLLQLHHVRPRSGSAPPGWRWTLVLQILLLGALTVVGGENVPALQYAGTVAGVVLFHVRRPWSWAVAGGLILVSGLVSQHHSGVDLTATAPQAVALWMTLSLPWTLLTMIAVAALCRLPLAAEELVVARRELARLAVLRERLRIARNTHDLLGFHLAAIALKADLGGRLASTDPSVARVQLAEAGQVAEEALRSLRSVTAEPAGLSFADEVESARAMLTAAGTRVAVELLARPEPSVESPLAIVLREAVTNVVRHARATTCEIETRPVPGGIRLRITNDGVSSASPGATAGNGLANLQSRAREAGGRLEVHRQGDRFTLVAEIRTGGPEGRLPDAVVSVAG